MKKNTTTVTGNMDKSYKCNSDQVSQTQNKYINLFI